MGALTGRAGRSRPRSPLSSSFSLLLGVTTAVAAAAVVAPSCQDPVHDQEVAALGPENPQIPRRQYHRAGQPCTVCHGPEGPAQTEFSIAGTIFWQPFEQASGANQGELGANNATISLIDDLGVPIQVSSNCVGNFWVTPAAYKPAFPVLVKIFAEEGRPSAATCSPRSAAPAPAPNATATRPTTTRSGTSI